jgi:hypothetical protein
MKNSLISIIVLFLITGILMPGMANSQEENDLTKNILDALSAYESFYVKGDTLPVAIKFMDADYAPTSDVKCTLIINDRKEEYTSDEDGIVTFWIPKKDKKGIKCFYTYPSKIDCGYCMSSLITVGEKVEREVEAGEGMEEMRFDNTTILYPEDASETAEELKRIVKEEKQLIKDILGVEPIPWRIILSKKTNPIYASDHGISLYQDSIHQKVSYYRELPHEWTESTIMGRVDEMEEYRWIRDGLAEYVGYQYVKKHWPQYFLAQAEVISLFQDKKREYDLAKWKQIDLFSISLMTEEDQIEAALEDGKKYYLSAYFWEKIVDKSGRKDVIKVFLERFAKLEDKNLEQTLQILSEITGLDIRNELVITGEEFTTTITKYWPLIEPPPDM